MLPIFVAIGLLAGLALLTIEIPILAIFTLAILLFIVALISQNTGNSILKTIITPPTIDISSRPGKYVVYAWVGMLLAIIVAFIAIPIHIGPLRWMGIFTTILAILYPFMPHTKNLK